MPTRWLNIRWDFWADVVLGTSPIYIRDGRLSLASIALSSAGKTIATIVYESEATFQPGLSRT